MRFVVPFWGAIVCGNIWSATGHPLFGLVWIIFALGILILGILLQGRTKP